MLIKLNLYGAGGHAAVVADAAHASGCEIIRVVDDDQMRVGQKLLNMTIQKLEDAQLEPAGNTSWHVAVGANDVRRKIGQRLHQQGATLITITHPHATISDSCEIGAGCLLAARVVVAPRSTIETGVIVNHSAVIDHDCKIGAWAHIAPGAILGGGVAIGSGSLVGAGAVILPNVTVGAGATIGAGSVLRNDVPANSTWAGCPAKRI